MKQLPEISISLQNTLNSLSGHVIEIYSPPNELCWFAAGSWSLKLHNIFFKKIFYQVPKRSSECSFPSLLKGNTAEFMSLISLTLLVKNAKPQDFKGKWRKKVLYMRVVMAYMKKKNIHNICRYS